VLLPNIIFDILLRVTAEGILSVSVSVSGGDCRVAVPPNPGMVRVRVGFMDCCESSEVGLLEVPSPRYSYPQPNGNSCVVFIISASVSLTRLGVSLYVAFKQSGTASATASASIHDTERNRPFT
jgi:hypothetical protein